MPVSLTIILALGGSAFISSLVGFIVSRVLKNAFTKRDEAIAAAREQESKDRADLEAFRFEKEQKERLVEMQNLIKPVQDDMIEIKELINKIADGTLSTLRNDITACYYRCREKGYRNDYDYQNIHDMDDAYNDLGGNSYIADIMDRFDDLPVKEDTVPTKVVERKVKEIVKEKEHN